MLKTSKCHIHPLHNIPCQECRDLEMRDKNVARAKEYQPVKIAPAVHVTSAAFQFVGSGVLPNSWNIGTGAISG